MQKRKPQASSMMLTSLEDNLSECSECEKRRRRFEEASLADIVIESSVRGAVRGSSVLGDALSNVFRGLGDAVRACTEPLVRTSSYAQPVVLLARPKPRCTTCGNGSNSNNANGKDDENANANNNQNTINIVVHGYPPQGGFTAPQSPFQNNGGTPQSGSQGAMQAAPFQASPFVAQAQAQEQQQPQVIREIIREPVIVEKIVEKPTFVEKIRDRMQLVKRIPDPQKVYIKKTKNNYVDIVRPTVETSFDAESINRNYAQTQFDSESILRPTRQTEFDTNSVNRTSVAPAFDQERVTRPTQDITDLKVYLKQKQAAAK
jgi:hypothetical protein